MLSAFIILMLGWNIALSFTRFPGFGRAQWIGLRNYVNIFTDVSFWQAALHSLYYVIPMAIVPTVLALFLSTAVFDAFRGRVAEKFVPWVRGGFYLPQIIPIAISGTIWGWVLSQNGLLNQLLTNLGLHRLTHDWLNIPIPALMSLTVIMIWLQTGFAFVIFLAGLARIDIASLEAASVDGASWRHRAWHLMLPTLVPEIAVVSIITIVGGFKVFAPIAYVTFGGPQGSTQSAASYAVNSFFGGGYVGGGAAVATLLALLIGVTVSLLATVFVRSRAQRRTRETQGEYS